MGLFSAAVGTPDQVARQVAGSLAVVTGASRGIGYEVARRLCAVGATVVGIARSADALDALAGDCFGRFHPLVGDLRDLDWAGNAGREVVSRWGTPVLLVSNAGHSIHRPLADYLDRFHDIHRTAGVNYLGGVALALPIVAAMRQVGRGHLVSVSTTSLDFPIPHWSAYAASKGAYETWLRTVGPELRSQGVATTSVHLSRVTTAMSAPTAGRYALPEMNVAQAADILCRVIATRQRFFIPWWARLGAAVSAGLPGAVGSAWELALKLGVRP